MKGIIFILLVLAQFANIFAQNENSSVLNWGERKLRWEDFQGIAIQKSNDITYLSYTIGYKTFEKEIDGVNIKWFEAYAYIDKNTSWVKENYRKDILLTYNQTIFDIVELYARKFQFNINESPLPNHLMLQKIDQLLRESSSQCKIRLAEFNYDTENSNNSDAIERWKSKIKIELEQTPKILVPSYKVSKFGLGVTFDLGYGFLTNPINKKFSNPFDISYGFDFEYDPIVVYLRGILGFSSIKGTFINKNYEWNKNSSIGIALLDVSIGHPVYEFNRFKITPFVGYGVTEFTNKDLQETTETYRLTDTNFSFGINVDYHFVKNVNLIDYFWLREKSGWILRARITTMPFDYGNDLKGWTFNFTIGIGGVAKFVTL